MITEEAIAQVEERRRAEARAKLCKSRVSREPIPGKPDAHAVRVDGREVGLLRRNNAVADWSAVYLENGADLHLGTWRGKAIALGMLKQHVMREDECRVVAELDVAVELARDLMPAGVTVRRGLREIRRVLLAGTMSPAVATMNAVHLLAHVTGVNASR